MKVIINLHSISRRYFINRMNDIKIKCLPINRKFQEIYIKNNYNVNYAMKEFENDCTSKKLIDELNESYSNWQVREGILEAILINIESIILENLKSLSQFKEEIKIACYKAKIDKRKHFNITNEEINLICIGEKDMFYDFINNISNKNLNSIEPLFYRMVIAESKIIDIEEKIYGLRNRNFLSGEAILCFKQEDVTIKIDIKHMREILKTLKLEKVYEINTGGVGKASYIMDISAFSPFDTDGFNIYWCTDKLDWSIEKNHEGYYIFYGQELMEEVKKLWDDWSKFAVNTDNWC